VNGTIRALAAVGLTCRMSAEFSNEGRTNIGRPETCLGKMRDEMDVAQGSGLSQGSEKGGAELFPFQRPYLASFVVSVPAQHSNAPTKQNLTSSRTSSKHDPVVEHRTYVLSLF
jgi:hypothetical protein